MATRGPGYLESMARQMQIRRTDSEYQALLRVLLAGDGVCADPILRQELLDTGYVRRDAGRRVRLHLTDEGRRFLAPDNVE